MTTPRCNTEVLAKFDEHFVPRVNVLHERALFYSRAQQPDENVETYVRKLYELSEHANFPNREESIRDRLVLGVRDRELSEKLQLQANLTLKDAVQQARQFELVKYQLSEQRHDSSTSIDAVTHRPSGSSALRQGHNNGPRGGARTKKPDYNSYKGGNEGRACTNCGHHHNRGATCPAKGKKCRTCGKPNHFERVCRSSKKVNNVPEINETRPANPVNRPKSPKYFLGSIDQHDEEPPWRTKLTMNGRAVDFKIDTGADVSVISKEVYDSLQPRPRLRQSDAILRSPGGTLPYLGMFTTNVDIGNQQTVPFRVFVLNNCDNLLSRDAALRLGLVKRLDNINDLAFGEVGRPVQCDPIKIRLRDDATPYSISTARRIPLPLLPKVEQELQRMEENGVIERITEPTDWCAPMVPVMKKGGGVRICVDLKKLNRAVKRERYMLPTLEDVMHKLRGSTVFTKLDATSGFWQLPLDDATAKLTTFMTPFGRYFFRRLPFGISLAPEVFQRTMENILGDIEGVECYMDDILVHADGMEEHDRRLDQAPNRLAQTGLKLNREKCEFRKEEISFLGHIVSKDGVKPDPSKLDAIRQMEDPRDVPELRRWLGMVNYLGRFLPDLSTVLTPLNDLLHKDTPWTWDQPQATAVKKVKDLLSEAPTLAFYDATKQTIVSADASSYGLGGVLLQHHNGQLKPVAYCSRTLTPAEKEYAQIEKEYLAMVWACEKFERYLVGLGLFTALTDHRPLVALVNTKNLQETPLRCQRLLMRLMRYNVTAEYAPGKDMVVADTLSRSPLNRENGNHLQQDVQDHVNEITSSWPASDSKLRDVKRHRKT